jgi:hypothetical protein
MRTLPPINPDPAAIRRSPPRPPADEESPAVSEIVDPIGPPLLPLPMIMSPAAAEELLPLTIETDPDSC